MMLSLFAPPCVFFADSINNSSADGDAVDRLNAQIAAMSDRIDAQHAELTEKQARIDELTAALNNALF